ncbi:hypothetical protein [Rhodopseudomonas palustris]|uniref:hypothetical protein n=1 Tax=Rhodopseudomonas palustris TaxID=1076 RepID=UPI000642337D|nr:hypothetical protein [Rhodopseudomonas palustris]
MSGDNDDDLTNRLLESEDLRDTRDYLSRGRLLANLNDAELGDRWVGTFRAWLTGEAGLALRNMNDAAAELRLRSLALPYDRVAREMDSIQRAFIQIAPDASPITVNLEIEEFLRVRGKLMG